jgi:hypothetical protein
LLTWWNKFHGRDHFRIDLSDIDHNEHKWQETSLVLVLPRIGCDAAAV